MPEAKKKVITKTKSAKQAADEFWQLDKKEEAEVGQTPEEFAETDWLSENYDGQLSIDVYQTTKDIVIKSTIAGVKPEDIDISINKDMVTIRGKRQQDEEISESDYLYQECYWGGFSRSIILPTDIKEDKVKATLKNGILIVVLPKANKPKSQNIKVKEEE